MKTKYIVVFKEDEKCNRYPYIDMGSEDHGRTSFRLWISDRLVERDKDDKFVITFPKRHAEIQRTVKGSLILRASESRMVYDIFVPCGYRGDSSFTILTEHYNVFKYRIFRSERGSLGISQGALVNAPDGEPLKYSWERTGRLYGDSPEGITILMPDGEEREFDNVPDGLEALAELPVHSVDKE